MKLLVISHLFPNSSFPTFGVFVLRQLEMLTKHGVEIRVISPIPFAPRFLTKFNPKWAAYHNIPKHDVFGEIEVFHPRYFRPPGRWFRPFSGAAMYASALPVVQNLKKRFKFDVILANSTIPDGDVALRLSKKFNTPGFCYAIGDDVLTYPHENFLMMKKTRRVLRNLAGVISHGDGLKAKIVALIGESPHVKTIYRGCDLNVFKPDVRKRRAGRKRLGLGKNEILVLFVGFLEELKGVAEIMTAFSKLLQKHAHLQLVLVGENLMPSEIERWLADENIRAKVTLPGAQPHHDLPDFYNAADIFVLPSHWEGTPNALVEAAACGLPVVSTKIPGAREILGKKYENVLVEPYDSLALEKKIDEFIQSRELREAYGKIAQARVQSRFDAQKNAKILRDFLFPQI